jgi:hypothetical protein
MLNKGQTRMWFMKKINFATWSETFSRSILQKAQMELSNEKKRSYNIKKFTEHREQLRQSNLIDYWIGWMSNLVRKRLIWWSGRKVSFLSPWDPYNIHLFHDHSQLLPPIKYIDDDNLKSKEKVFKINQNIINFFLLKNGEFSSHELRQEYEIR